MRLGASCTGTRGVLQDDEKKNKLESVPLPLGRGREHIEGSGRGSERMVRWIQGKM